MESQPWPEIIMHSFFTAGTSAATSEKPFYGSWNRLLNTLFPPDTIFEVVPQFPAVTAREAVDFVLLLIYVNSTPVFIVEVKPPADFRLISKRQEADLELRKRFLDISPDMKIPVLHGVSAFGTEIAFYTYDCQTGRMEPGSQANPDINSDSSIKQSPCEVAAALAGICVGSRGACSAIDLYMLAPIIQLEFDLAPLDPGVVYLGPSQDSAVAGAALFITLC